MFDLDLNRILFTLPGILIGLVFHEFAHALASDRLGDPTPRHQGRLSLSPLPHLDPIGFILILLVGFGWARPVQVNPRYYKHPRRDEIIVSVAGPLTNLFLAFIFAAIFKIFVMSGADASLSKTMLTNISLLFILTIRINISLFLFNLIPIPPLDGFHVLANIVPPKYYRHLYTLHQYSNVILILLIITGATSFILGPPSDFIFSTIVNLLNV